MSKSREAIKEAIAPIQERDDGGLDQCAGSGSDETWLDFWI